MKILIKTGVKERKLLLPIPSKIILKGLLKQAGVADSSRIKKDIKSILRCLKEYKKEYKKEYGAFALVEVEEESGDTVKIIV